MSLKQNTSYVAPDAPTKGSVVSNAFDFTFSKGVSPCVISNTTAAVIRVNINTTTKPTSTTGHFIVPAGQTLVLPDSVGVVSGAVYGTGVTLTTDVLVYGWSL